MQRSGLGTKPSSGHPVTLVGASPGKMCGRREGGWRRGIRTAGSAPGDIGCSVGHLISGCHAVHLPQSWNFYQIFGNWAKHLTCAQSQTTAFASKPFSRAGRGIAQAQGHLRGRPPVPEPPVAPEIRLTWRRCTALSPREATIYTRIETSRLRPRIAWSLEQIK